MYEVYSEIFNKVFAYLNIIKEIKEEIKHIDISNEIAEEHFGRRYCRIYVNIVFKENSTGQGRLNELIFDKFEKYWQKEYFSFHLAQKHRDDIKKYNRRGLLRWYMESFEMAS